MAKYADALITINKEDYARGKKFAFNEVYYVNGVGLDTGKFRNASIEREKFRKDIGVPAGNMMFFSIGDALGKLRNDKITYVICGQGYLEHYLKDKCKRLGLSDNVKFLGYRLDIPEICKAADVFIFPSQREGLGIAALEAMASGLPLISSYVNGIRDYTENGKTGCTVLPHDVDGFAEAIDKMYREKEFREECGNYNMSVVRLFDINNTKNVVYDILSKVLCK